MKRLSSLLLVPLLVLVAPTVMVAQEPGPGRKDDSVDIFRKRPVPGDTLFVFEPARPLIDSSRIPDNQRYVLGVDFLFSASGLGFGGYLQRNVSSSIAGFINVGITGTRSTDEFPDYDGNVPNKVNRLYSIPLTVGIRYRILKQALVDNFRPYVNAGFGPSVILALPYEYPFFPSIGHATMRITGCGFIGVGAEFGAGQPILGVNARYFVIPLRGGLESIRNSPITDFGGLFLTLNIGFAP